MRNRTSRKHRISLNEKKEIVGKEAANTIIPHEFRGGPSTSSAYKQIGTSRAACCGWHVAMAVQNFWINTYQFMIDYLKQLFSDKNITQRIKEKMPDLFQLVQTDSSRMANWEWKCSVREKIIIALLIYTLAKKIQKSIFLLPNQKPDVILFSNPISIKNQISGSLSGVKLIWTVDRQKASNLVKITNQK